MAVTYVVAMDRNGGIGYRNKLPWHLPADLRFFKETTMGHPIVMGRKTYESIGRPLPNRTNMVLTRDLEYKPAPEVIVVHTPEEALGWFREHRSGLAVDELMVIGGAEIFRLFQPYVDKLIVTWIDYSFEADTFFPGLPLEEHWQLESAVPGVTDEKNPYSYEFRVYRKRKG